MVSFSSIYLARLYEKTLKNYMLFYHDTKQHSNLRLFVRVAQKIAILGLVFCFIKIYTHSIVFDIYKGIFQEVGAPALHFRIIVFNAFDDTQPVFLRIKHESRQIARLHM